MSVSDEEARGTTTTRRALPPVPWSALDEVVDSRQGKYHQAWMLSRSSSDIVLIEERVAYDLDTSMIDRRINWYFDPETGESYRRESRADRFLRFIYDSSDVFMWHSDIEAICGTQWAKWQSEDLSATTGLGLGPDDWPVVPPIETLRAIADPGSPVKNDEDASVYAVTVPGGAEVGMSSIVSDPELADRIASQAHSAEVTLPREDGPIEVAIDLSDDMVAITGRSLGADMSAKLKWTLTAPVDAVDITVPSSASDRSSCE